MNKQSNIVKIKYKPGDLVMDSYGEIAKILEINGTKSKISYVGSGYVDDASMEYILESYVPCAFQIGDKITYKYERFTIVSIMRSDINRKYYYQLRGERTDYYELVINIYSSGQFTESQVLSKTN